MLGSCGDLVHKLIGTSCTTSFCCLCQMEVEAESRDAELVKLNKLNETFSERVKSLEEELNDLRRKQTASGGELYALYK